MISLMSKRRIVWIAAVFILSLLTLSAAAPSEKITRIQQQLVEIEQQLEPLEKQLEEYRKKALNEEMEAQPLMFDNWQEYAAKVQAMEEEEKSILKLRKKIIGLKKQRDALEQELTTLSPKQKNRDMRAKLPSTLYNDSLALLTDLYQLTMAYGYWKAGLDKKEWCSTCSSDGIPSKADLPLQRAWKQRCTICRISISMKAISPICSHSRE